jgi:hypothetical protein
MSNDSTPHLTNEVCVDLEELLAEMRGCNEAACILGETEELDTGLKNGLYFLHVEMRRRLDTMERLLSGKEASDV